MIVFGARTAAVLAVLGFAFSSLSGVTAAPAPPVARAPPLARVVRSCTKSKVAALTFDDGPYQYTTEAMNILERNGAKGTFFVNGNNWGNINDKADLLRSIDRRGHQIASHTWSHSHLPQLSPSQIDNELRSLHDTIRRITGKSVAFMRPPYGEYNDAVRRVAASLGETVVLWDLDSGDSTGKSVAAQRQEYTNARGRNNILSLQHDVHQTSIRDVLPSAIKTLKDAGFRLVTVAECLGERPYN